MWILRTTAHLFMFVMDATDLSLVSLQAGHALRVGSTSGDRRLGNQRNEQVISHDTLDDTSELLYPRGNQKGRRFRAHVFASFAYVLLSILAFFDIRWHRLYG